MLKKSLVLKSVSGSDEKGVLSLQFDGGNLQGQLRLYGFATEPKGILSLGLTMPQKVVKAGLTRQANMYFTFSSHNIDILPDIFSCAIVNFVGGQLSPLLFGSAGEKSIQNKLDEVTNALKETNSAADVEKVLDDFGIDYDDDLKQEIEETIDTQMQQEDVCEKDCANCVYKKYFYQNGGKEEQESFDFDDLDAEQNLQDFDDNLSENSQILQKNDQKTQKNQFFEQESEILSKSKNKVIFSVDESLTENTKSQDKKFFNEIKNQVDDLFSVNKAEEFLQDAIPNSKWVKVEFDKDGDYYVFGLIYDEDELKFVCYGIPSLYSQFPPKQLSGYPVWFPVDKNKNEGFGYWLTYQDAETGEAIKAIIE